MNRSVSQWVSRRVSRRVLVLTTTALCCTGIGGSMSGCETTQLRSILGSQTAMDLLSPMVKDAAKAYITDLTSLSGLLGNVDSIQGVMDFISSIQPTIDQLKKAYQTLANTSGDERRWLLEAFGPDIRDANAKFLNISDEATSDWAWKQLLKPVLEKVALFEAS